MPAAPWSMTWNTAGLTSKLKSAAYQAARDVRMAAEARNPARSKIRIVGPYKLYGGMEGYAVIGKGPLAHIFEGGRTGGYPIVPGLQTTHGKRGYSVRGSRVGKGESQFAIKFTRGDGGFYRGAGFLGGPMAARPYMGPAAALWPTLYSRRAAAMLGGLAGGFG